LLQEPAGRVEGLDLVHDHLREFPLLRLGARHVRHLVLPNERAEIFIPLVIVHEIAPARQHVVLVGGNDCLALALVLIFLFGHGREGKEKGTVREMKKVRRGRGPLLLTMHA
jgi:hypothetical protein